MMMRKCVDLLRVLLLLQASLVAANRIAFEKLTDLDYRGNTYYTIRNLSLYECQGWCREEPGCRAAAFSFVANPLTPQQETMCLLQNETTALNPSSPPERAVSTYYMVKLKLRSDNVCSRPWTFERVPNKLLRGLDNALIFTSTKHACLSACLNEQRFPCRSAEYNYVTLQCHLSEFDRRSVEEYVELADAPGVDYFENLCLKAKEACKGKRTFEVPQLGVAEDSVNRYIDTYFYVDKELMVGSRDACKRACALESEFLCRSFLWKGPPGPKGYNCQMFHLDHALLPDGVSTFLTKAQPLIDVGGPVGTFYENICQKPRDHMICRQVVTKDKRFITQIMCYEKPLPRQTDTGVLLDALPDTEETGDTFDDLSAPEGAFEGGHNHLNKKEDANCDYAGTCYNVYVKCRDTKIVVGVSTSKPFSGRIYALGRSQTCNVDVEESDKFRLDLTMSGQDCNTQSSSGVYTNTVVVQRHSIVMTSADKIYKVRCVYELGSKNISFGMMPISNNLTGKLPPGAEGPSASGHLNVRDPDMLTITSAPVAPPPRMRILDKEGREVETVRIGDKLRFRIEIPESTPYGILARSCVAMAKDSKSTFPIVDDKGCPLEPTIFPRFNLDGNALESVYEAFRFTESYGVIFQCNVKYCLGPCDPVLCPWGRQTVESYGRKKRATEQRMKNSDAEDMTLSQEILVLDFGDEQKPTYKGEAQSSSDEPITVYNSCPTKTSVLALAVTCSLLLLIYVCTVFYFLMRRWVSLNAKQAH